MRDRSDIYLCGHRTHSTVLMKSLRASPKTHKEGRADVKWRRPPEKSGKVVAAGKSDIGSGRTDLSAAPISLKIGAELAEPSIIAGGPRHRALRPGPGRMLDVASLSRSSKNRPIRVGSPIWLVDPGAKTRRLCSDCREPSPVAYFLHATGASAHGAGGAAPGAGREGAGRVQKVGHWCKWTAV